MVKNPKDIAIIETPKGAGASTPKAVWQKAAAWDPAQSWRQRREDGRRFLKSLERKYLRDVLVGLERTGRPIEYGFVVRPIRDNSVGEATLPGPLQKLAVNGLVTITTTGNELRCYLTTAGVDGVRNWLLTKPPNFQLLFPRLYRQLANTGGITLDKRRGFRIDHRHSEGVIPLGKAAPRNGPKKE